MKKIRLAAGALAAALLAGLSPVSIAQADMLPIYVMTKSVDNEGYTTTYTTNAKGLITKAETKRSEKTKTEDTSFSSTTTYTYTAAGLLKSAALTEKEVIKTYVMDGNGLPTAKFEKETTQTTANTTYKYDEKNRMIKKTVKTPEPKVTNVDADGNKTTNTSDEYSSTDDKGTYKGTTQTTQIEVTNYTYNANDKLEKVVRDSYDHSTGNIVFTDAQTGEKTNITFTDNDSKQRTTDKYIYNENGYATKKNTTWKETGYTRTYKTDNYTSVSQWKSGVETYVMKDPQGNVVTSKETGKKPMNTKTTNTAYTYDKNLQVKTETETSRETNNRAAVFDASGNEKKDADGNPVYQTLVTTATKKSTHTNSIQTGTGMQSKRVSVIKKAEGREVNPGSDLERITYTLASKSVDGAFTGIVTNQQWTLQNGGTLRGLPAF